MRAGRKGRVAGDEDEVAGQDSGEPAFHGTRSEACSFESCGGARWHLLGRIGEFRIAYVQRSDGWFEFTWNNMSGID
jgi:hypothetical protein